MRMVWADDRRVPGAKKSTAACGGNRENFSAKWSKLTATNRNDRQFWAPREWQALVQVLPPQPENNPQAFRLGDCFLTVWGWCRTNKSLPESMEEYQRNNSQTLLNNTSAICKVNHEVIYFCSTVLPPQPKKNTSSARMGYFSFIESMWRRTANPQGFADFALRYLAH